MADYAFYVNSYLGSAIPEPEFPGWAAKAAAELARMERVYWVEGGQEARAMAVCAMAERLRAWAREKGGVAYQSVGGVSVRYAREENRARQLQRELYQAARTYLDIYRGCSHVE